MRCSFVLVAWVAVVPGCKRTQVENNKLDGPLPVAFGDCAAPTTAWVSGPRPAPFTPADADYVWIEDGATKTASAAPEPEQPSEPPDHDTTTNTSEAAQHARQQALEQARAAGVLGSMVTTNGDAFASLTGTGDISSELDGTDIDRGLLGGEVGVMKDGFGYGRTGFAPGGGTGQATIGIGRYGTIGHGMGTGSSYGIGGGRRMTSGVPSVRIGQLVVQGDLDKAIIRRVIKRNLPKIQYCYEKELHAQPTLQGTVTTKFFIAPNGEVASSEAEGVHPAVASCVARMIKSMVFPKARAPVGVHVSNPFTFRPAAGSNAGIARARNATEPPPRVGSASDETSLVGSAAPLPAGKRTPPSPNARRRLYREPGAYDRTYRPGATNPLAAAGKALEDCLRTGTQRAGVAVVELEYDSGGRTVARAAVHGIDDKRVSDCIAKVAKNTTGTPGTPAQRCSFSYGELPLSSLPVLDITETAITLQSRELAKVAGVDDGAVIAPTVASIVDAVKARLEAVTSQQAPVVAVHGPLVIRAVAATPMRVVKRVIASVLSAGDDFVLAAQQGADWQLVEPLAVPVVPVPFGTGGTWHHVRGTGDRNRGVSEHSPDTTKPFAIVVGPDKLWVGASGGEGQELATGPEQQATLREALKALRATRPTSEIRIAARDQATYGAFVTVVHAAIEAGFADWQLVDVGAVVTSTRSTSP